MSTVETSAIADRMLSALNDATAEGRAMTTREVCEAAGPYLKTFGVCFELHHSEDFESELVECDGRRHVIAVSLMHFQRGYQILCRLRDTGQVRHARIEGKKDAYWTASPQVPRVPVDAIEAAYLAPDATPWGGRSR